MRTDGRMNKYEEANKRVSQFCKRAQKLVDIYSHFPLMPSWAGAYYYVFLTTLLPLSHDPELMLEVNVESDSFSRAFIK